MQTKMIVTDLDGTLLRRDKSISAYTASVFQRCHKQGIKIVFATARPIRAVKMLNLRLPFDAAIYHNGAVVNIGNTTVLRYGISPEATKKILLSALRVDYSAKLCVEIDDRLYGNFDPSDIWPGVETTVTDFTDLPDVPADKILFQTASLAELNAASNALPDDLYIEMSENTVGMVMNRDATKAKAIACLAGHYDLALADVVAFGDDYNDIGMLRECGVGVAVANAIDECKAAADHICGTNDNDGVAKWLEENAL